jgi:anti-sigma regulatory factor (Ser/Thr protein kinase)
MVSGEDNHDFCPVKMVLDGREAPMSTGGAQPFYNPVIVMPTEARADFPAEPASAGHARRFVDATLRTWSCDRLLDIATLLVSELVANAVLHAGTVIGVVVRLDGDRLRVEVHDRSVRAPARKHYSSLATTGRGLLLVERMSAEWGVMVEDDGKNVWFELDQTLPARQPELDLFDFDQIDLDDLEDVAVEETDPSRRSDRGVTGSEEGDPRLRALVWAGRP